MLACRDVTFLKTMRNKHITLLLLCLSLSASLLAHASGDLQPELAQNELLAAAEEQHAIGMGEQDLLDELRAYELHIALLKKALEAGDGDALESLMARAKHARDRWMAGELDDFRDEAT